MKAKIKSAIRTTNGYKTKSAALLYLLLAAFGDKIPFIAENKEIAVNIVDILIASGLVHDVWRNRQKIIDYIKNIFKKQS